MDLLCVRLFGRVHVTFNELGPELKVTRTTQTLLAYLLLRRSFSSRDVLACLCWGDQPDEQARRCLNTALWRLRRQLEPQDSPRDTYLLATPAGEVGFNWHSDYWLDVESFEREVATALTPPLRAVKDAQMKSLEKALQLYTGDLLEGFYDEWALSERERLRGLYLDSLARLIRYHHSRGAWEEGLRCGQQLLRHEPLHEEIHREMMRLYAESGQRALAIRQYQLCRQILFDELGIAPMPETQALCRQIASADEPAQTASDTTTQPMTHHERSRTLLADRAKPVSFSRRPRTQAISAPAWRASLPQAITQLREALRQFEHARGELQSAIQLVERIAEHDSQAL